MTDVVLRTFFTVSGPREAVTAQADSLMEALVDAIDDHVFDPAIAYDSDAELTEVEVSARGADELDAESRALGRVAEALRTAGIHAREMSERRSVELVPA